MAVRELYELRTEAAGLAGELAALRYRHLAGLPRRAGLPDLIKAHKLASSADGLAQACEAHGDAVAAGRSPARLQRLAALRGFLAEVRALALDPGAAQELLELEQRPSVRPPGDAGLHGAIPLVQVERELPYEVSRDKRGELERALADAVALQAPLRTAAWDAAQSVLADLRLGEPAQAALALQAGTFGEGADAAAQAERLLRATDSITQDLGGWLVERHTTARPFPRGAERHDVLHLLHAPHCASAFPRGELQRTCRRWAEMLRLDLDANSAIKLDDDERPLKSGGAFAVAIDPPGEVRLSLFPHLGPRPLAELLAALGTGLLLAGPPGDAPPEDLWLGDAGVRVASGALFAGFLSDPIWLRRCAKADLHRDDERALAYAGVVKARLAAAATLSSLEAHRLGGLSHKAEAAHRDLYARAAGAELPAALGLRDMDPWLGSWAELRGLSLAARLRAGLREKHDEDWWRNPRALPVLRGLWARGGRPTVAELWAELGEDKPSVDALAAELIQACG